MSNFNISLHNFTKYFREVSVVVIGVAITLSVSYWIGINNEKRDMALYLNAVKMELEENYKYLEEATERFRPTHAYSEYLSTHDKKDLERDSIMAYSNVWHNAFSITFKKNAFEMFKSSGSMRLEKDKNLLLSIWNAYKELSDLEQQTEFFTNEKWAEIKKEIFTFLDMIETQGDIGLYKMIENTNIVPMYNFHTIGVDRGTMQKYEDALESTKETLEKLEKVL